MSINRYCDGLQRRDFLKVGALTGLGLTLPNFLKMSASAIAPFSAFWRIIAIWSVDAFASVGSAFFAAPSATNLLPRWSSGTADRSVCRSRRG